MDFDLSAAHRALAAFCGAMNGRYRGKYWMTCGTLLGAIRDGEFIKHDGDLDFGMRISDLDDCLVQTLTVAGIHLIKETGSRENGLTMTFSDGSVKLDIFFVYEEGDRLWHAVANGRPQVCYYYSKFRIAPYVFKGVETSIPEPPTTVLEANYGSDWRRPVRRWHYAYSPFNVVVRGGALLKTKYLAKMAIWELKSRGKVMVRRLRERTRPVHRGVRVDG